MLSPTFSRYYLSLGLTIKINKSTTCVRVCNPVQNVNLISSRDNNNHLKMPTDTKRLPVPEDSKNPRYFSQGDEAIKLINSNGKRFDGRATDQIRPVFLKTGVVTQARGSAYMETGNTKVIVAVYGPREVTRRQDFSMAGQLMCEFKMATFASPVRRGHQPDAQEKDYSVLIQEALEPAVRMDKFPKSRMDVFVTVLEDDGSCLAASLTCSSVALADAGVEMYDLVIGFSLRQFGDQVLLDPSRQEEQSEQTDSDRRDQGCITLGFLPSLHQVSALHQHGILTSDTSVQGVRQLISTCQRLYPVVQKCLGDSLT